MALVRNFYRSIASVPRNQLMNIKKTNFKVSTYQDCQHYVVPKRFTSSTQPLCNPKEVKVTFIRASGERIEAKGKVGDSLLDIVVNNEIDLDGYGACEGTLTCSTCHLIFSKEVYDSLPDKPTDEELDMLDLAYDLTETSRLGCQITMTKELDGLEVHVPATINDARS